MNWDYLRDTAILSGLALLAAVGLPFSNWWYFGARRLPSWARWISLVFLALAVGILVIGLGWGVASGQLTSS